MNKNQLEISRIINIISRERLIKYGRGNDISADFDEVLKKYLWNINLSQALYAQLHLFEIFLRNRVNSLASSIFGDDWLTNKKVLISVYDQKKITDAIIKIKKKNKNLDNGRLIAELSLGFWTGLFGHEYYNNFTSKIIMDVFPYLEKSQNRNQIIRLRLKEMRDLRNRIFHFEPIFNSTPSIIVTYQKLLEIISWLSAEKLELHTKINTLESVVNSI